MTKVAKRYLKNAVVIECGKSKISEYIRGEHPKDRHARRHFLALNGLDETIIWCEYRSISFTVSDTDGFPMGKWMFRKKNGFATWMTHLGRLNFKKDFRGQLHFAKVHDYQQLLRILEEWV